MRNLRDMIGSLYETRNDEKDHPYQKLRTMRRSLIRDLIVLCRQQDERQANG